MLNEIEQKQSTMKNESSATDWENYVPMSHSGVCHVHVLKTIATASIQHEKLYRRRPQRVLFKALHLKTI